ncbi:MAG: D-alanyl-D-alanine carboxypeptidase [Solirubrobacterales bacterium]|nr:D-alanyl-D-alanine carboxypeptidase [Solirubrobacterales bacterium]
MPRLWWGVLAGLVLLLAAAAYVVYALVRSPPGATVVPVSRAAAFAGPRSPLAWPNQGEAALAVRGVGFIGSHGPGQPTPIASIAKVMTAYVVLHDHPLHVGAAGPQITVTPADAAVFDADRGTGQSVVPVQPGERLTERQALEGMLLPSGNNIAAMLARWDAGSEGAFVARMNATAGAMGLAHTHYSDASGVAASTVSTAGDQVHLGMRAMAVPVFAQIVGMAQTNLPVAGRQYNKNALLGRNGIVGIKTGTTSEAGGCFLFAAEDRLAGRTVTIVGAVLHQLASGAQPSIIAAAFAASTALLDSARRVVVKRRVLRRGTTLAWIKAPWADRVPLQAAASAALVGWPGLRTHTTIVERTVISGSVSTGQEVGSAVIAAGTQHDTVRLVAARDLQSPSLFWRLTHP